MSEGEEISCHQRIQQSLELVRIEIQKSSSRSDLKDELRSVAYEALVRAAQRYDPQRGIPFRAFARQRIRWALVDFQRREDRAYRRAKRASARVERLASLEGLPPSALSRDCLADPLQVAKERARVLEMEKWMSSLHEVAEPASPPTPLASTDSQDLLKHLMRALLPKERALLHALYREEISLCQFARREGISHSTASRRHAAVLRRLRTLIAGALPDSP